MGLTVLDAGVIVGFLDARDAHHAAAKTALLDRAGRQADLRLSTASYSESLVRPLRVAGDEADRVDVLLSTAAVELVPVRRAIARRAAALRARHGSRLRLPDALVLATAEELAADEVLTTDGRWPDVGLSVTVLAR